MRRCSAVRGISNYIIYTVQNEYKIPQRQPNILEPEEGEEEVL